MPRREGLFLCRPHGPIQRKGMQKYDRRSGPLVGVGKRDVVDQSLHQNQQINCDLVPSTGLTVKECLADDRFRCICPRSRKVYRILDVPMARDQHQTADLFTTPGTKPDANVSPLAARMRPRSFEDFIGQDEIVGPDRPLRKAIEADRLSSVIFWGPPGCGKTTLAHLIVRYTKAHFVSFSSLTTANAALRQADLAPPSHSLYKGAFRLILRRDERDPRVTRSRENGRASIGSESAEDDPLRGRNPSVQ